MKRKRYWPNRSKKFALERVDENAKISFKDNGNIDFFAGMHLHNGVVPGDRNARFCRELTSLLR